MRPPESETEQSCVLDREHRKKMSKTTDVLYLVSVEFLNHRSWLCQSMSSRFSIRVM